MDRVGPRKISTVELVSLLRAGGSRPVEASLNNRGLNATHILQYHMGRILDCGIDSRDVVWTVKDFIGCYPNAYWKLDQVL